MTEDLNTIVTDITYLQDLWSSSQEAKSNNQRDKIITVYQKEYNRIVQQYRIWFLIEYEKIFDFRENGRNQEKRNTIIENVVKYLNDGVCPTSFYESIRKDDTRTYSKDTNLPGMTLPLAISKRIESPGWQYSRYGVDDLLLLEKNNKAVFRNATPRIRNRKDIEKKIEYVELQIGVDLHQTDFYFVLTKWDYLRIGRHGGIFGRTSEARAVTYSEWVPNTINFDTHIARYESKLPKKYVVIYNDPSVASEYGVLDTETGEVLACNRWNVNDVVHIKSNIIDYIVDEFILNWRQLETKNGVAIKWPTELRPKLKDDFLRLKEEFGLDETFLPTWIS